MVQRRKRSLDKLKPYNFPLRTSKSDHTQRLIMFKINDFGQGFAGSKWRPWGRIELRQDRTLTVIMTVPTHAPF